MSDRRTVTYRDRQGSWGQVCFERHGVGTPVVLIHGVGLQSGVWRPQIAALSAAHDVIAVDLLGHGGSSLPPADARLGDYSDAIVALLDALAVGRIHVIGHSMGALVGLDVALAHPARVRSVTAMNAVFCRTPDQRAAVMSRAAGGEAGPRDWSGTLKRWFGDPIPAAVRDEAARVEGFLDAIDPVGYERTYRLFATSDTAHHDRLSRLVAPALFLTGEGDLNSDASMSRAMAALAPLGRVEIVAGERHMMAVTAPAEIDRRLRAFLAEVDADGDPDGRGPDADLDLKEFRKALGSFPTGVTVVATLEEDGKPRGFTANSFTSLSLNPPLILVCIARTASSCPVFAAAAHFSINVLADHQADVSGLFATKEPDKFAKAAWHAGPAGSPVLDEVAAWFDCRRERVIEAGDHVILIGRVLAFDHAPTTPLGYCRGAYVDLGLNVDALAASGPRTRAGAILEHDGAILLMADGRGGLDLPWAPMLGTAGDPKSLTGRLRALRLETDVDFLFAVFDDPARGTGAMSVVYRGALRKPPEASDAVTLATPDAMPWGAISDGTVRAMLRRYIEERRTDLFGVYVGDADRGTVQRLARTA